MVDREHRGPRPAPEPDDRDAPSSPSHETTSTVVRRAAAEGARHALDAGTRSLASDYPLAAKLIRWLGGGLVLALSGATAGYIATDGEPEPTAPTERRLECDPAVEQHLLHLAQTGDDLARQLAADGLPQYASLVTAMTDVDQLPDDLKLCLLLAAKERAR